MRAKIAIFYLMIVALTVSCATTGKFKNMFDEDVATNRESVLHGSIPKAITDLSMLLEMDPKNSEARFLRALAYQKLEHYNKAAADYEGLLKYDSFNSKAHYNLGMIYAFKMNDKKTALKHFDKFIDLNPDHARSFSVAKIMLSIDKDDEEANPAELKNIIEEVLAERGLSRINSEEDIQKRKKNISDIIRMNPGSWQARFILGKVLEEDGKIDDAIKSYNAALEIRPTFAQCHYELGRLLLKTKKKDEGETHIMKAQLFDPNQKGVDAAAF